MTTVIAPPRPETSARQPEPTPEHPTPEHPTPEHAESQRHRSVLTRPRIDTVIVVTLAVMVSLLPAVLPRTSASQAILTGVQVAVAIGLASLLRLVLRRWRIDLDERFGRYRVPVLLVCGFVVSATAVRAASWQNGLHAAMGMAPAGAMYWSRCLLGAVLVVVVLVGIGRGLRWALRKCWGC